jgi:hypothetical protein
MLRPVPKLGIVVLRHLHLQKPLLGGSPDFDQSEVPTVFGVFEDVEEQAVWFAGAGCPDGTVGVFPLGD